jgi:hypothetical protein
MTSSTPPLPGQLRRWTRDGINLVRVGEVFLVLRQDEHVKKWGHDMEYFLVLMHGQMRSYSRSLIEEKSDAVSEAG